MNPHPLHHTIAREHFAELRRLSERRNAWPRLRRRVRMA